MLSWQDRALAAEKRVAELEDELKAYRTYDEDPEIAHLIVVQQLSRRMGRLSYLANGYRPAGVLMALVNNPDRVMTKDRLLRMSRGPRVWEDVGLRTIDVHVSRVRAVLRAIGCADGLQTVPGIGWRMDRKAAEVVKQKLAIP